MDDFGLRWRMRQVNEGPFLIQAVPRHKSDRVAARVAVDLGYPAVAPIMPALLEWLKDCNWPVAHILLPMLREIGDPLVPHIQHILATNDDIWKYWVLQNLTAGLSADGFAEIRSAVVRIAKDPTPAERTEELDEIAQDVLRERGEWRSEI